MARTTDRERLLALLAEAGGLSSARIKVELHLGDERYEQIRSEVIDEGLAEKYVCRGGGLRLTKKGERDVSPEYEAASKVEKETDLYEYLVEALSRESPESVVFDTGSLRKRGKWQNPDVMQVSVEVYPRLRRRRVLITSYEVKQWGRWDVNAVFEAASHARFAHAGFVVVEWTDSNFSISDPRLDQIVRECRRFGIGLATLEPYHSRFRLHVRLEPDDGREPIDAEVEEWLDYCLSRRSDAADRFDALMDATDKELRKGR